MSGPEVRSRINLCLIIPVLSCITVHAVILIGMLSGGGAYLRGYHANANPDARHYLREGRNTLLQGCFSRCSEEPYVPDMLRTPVYPVFSGSLDLLGGPLAIFLTQSALHICACALLFNLTARMLGQAAGLLAAMLLATDLMIATSAYQAMSEVLFMFLILASITVLIRRENCADALPSLAVCALSGLLLSAAALTRPAGLYAAIVIAGVLIVAALSVRQVRRGMICAATLLLLFSLPAALWIARNKIVFDVPRLSTADAIMLVYFSGGGAYEVEHGIGLEEAQSRIAHEFDLPQHTLTNNHWRSDLSVKEMDRKLRAAQWNVIAKYPVALLQSSLLGLVKAHGSHNVLELGQVWGLPWNLSASPTTSISTGRLATIFDNHGVLVLALIWQLLHAVVSWSLFAVGLFVLARRPKAWWPSMLVLCLLAYFMLTVVMVGKEAYWRYRTPHMPLVYVVAGASATLLAKWQRYPAEGRDLMQSLDQQFRPAKMVSFSCSLPSYNLGGWPCGHISKQITLSSGRIEVSKYAAVL